MKKLYNGKVKKIHPSPASSSPCDLLLAVLPAAIFALSAALSAEEKEVLAYLISGKVAEKKKSLHHPPELGCGCFGCYKSFWIRWDKSPNRYLIHQILDAVEESFEPLQVVSGRFRLCRFDFQKDFEEDEMEKGEFCEEGKDEGIEEEDYGEVEEGETNDAEDLAGVVSASKVRRFVSFIGEAVWGIWN